MDKSVSCMVLPVGDVSFLLPCTAIIEVFKSARGAGFDYEDPRNGISIGKVEWRYSVVPAVDLSGLTNCENRVDTTDQVFFAVINTAIKNRSGSLMHLAVALDDMPSLVKISESNSLDDAPPSVYTAHACTEAYVDGFGRLFVPDMKEVVRVFLGLSSVNVRAPEAAAQSIENHAHSDAASIFRTGNDEAVYNYISSMMSEATSEDSRVATAARNILRAAAAVLVSARDRYGIEITTDLITSASELPFMISALSGKVSFGDVDVELTMDIVGMVSDALRSLHGFDPDRGVDQDVTVQDEYGYAQMSIAYVIEAIANKP